MAELNDNDWYSVKEVAIFLKIAPETVRRKIRNKEIKANRIGLVGPYRVKGTEIKKILGIRIKE